MSFRERAAEVCPARGRDFASGIAVLLAAYDFWAVDSLCRVAGVNHQLGFAHDALVVVVGMIGDDQHAVVLAEIVQRRALHLQVVLAALSDGGKKRVVVADHGPLLLAAVR